MGEGTERYAASASIARNIQDEIAAESHFRASAAISSAATECKELFLLQTFSKRSS